MTNTLKAEQAQIVRRALHRAACQLRDDVELNSTRVSSRKGICSAIADSLHSFGSFTLDEQLRGKVFDLLEDTFTKWPEYSGDITYPVPRPAGYVSQSEHYWGDAKTEGMWTGEYGACRMRLLYFIIDATKSV